LEPREKATETKPQTPFKALSTAIQWITFVAIFALCIVISLFIGEGRGWAAGLSIGVITLVIQISWHLRKEAWFWIAIAFFAAVHAWAVLYLDWSWVSEGSGLKLLASLVVPDLSAMMAIIYRLFRLKYGTPAQEVEPSIDELPRYGERDITL
jgi:hypothetical protein